MVSVSVQQLHLWSSTRWRPRFYNQAKPHLILVQDVTEDTKTAEEPNLSDDGEGDSASVSNPSDEKSMVKVEAGEGKQEVPVAQLPRRASTSPPASLPSTSKLLTRLGSLDGESIGRWLTHFL